MSCGIGKFLDSVGCNSVAEFQDMERERLSKLPHCPVCYNNRVEEDEEVCADCRPAFEAGVVVGRRIAGG